MPGLDRTGPFGEGPRTGRGLGQCGPGTVVEGGWGRGRGPGWGRGGGGRGCGRGRGPGWGGGWGQGAGGGWGVQGRFDPEAEREMLRAEAESLAKALEQVRARLESLSEKEK